MLKLAVPSELRASRYGILAYQNPDIMKAMNDIAPECRLLELIDQHFDGKKPWVGRAIALETELLSEDSNVREQTRNLLRYFNSCGAYLSRLADKRPDRVKSWTVNGSKKYAILFPRNS